MKDELEIRPGETENQTSNARATGADNSTSGYEVGYGKPPKKHRFPKGRSGNPAGRKKTERIDDIRTLVDGILAETTQVREGAKVRTISKLEGILQAHRMEALKGNPKAARTFFKLAEKAGMLRDIMPESFVKLMEPGGDDGKVIRMYHAEEALARGSGEANQPKKRSGNA